MDEDVLAEARQMGINPNQISMRNGKPWYESKEFGQMNEVRIPSADSITLNRMMAKGETWGLGPKDQKFKNHKKYFEKDIIIILKKCDCI